MPVSLSLNKTIRRAWNSPTLTTWGSFAVNTINFFFVLPLLLTRLETAEIALWYLFKPIIDLQPTIDMGFGLTFSRVIAYGMGGANNLSNVNEIGKIESIGQPNWGTIARICSTMNALYKRLNLVSILLISTLGSWAMLKPVSNVADQTIAWAAWGFVLLSVAISLIGQRYTAYLQGVNQIALFRRYEIFLSLAAMISSFTILLLHGNLLILVVAAQSWRILNVAVNRWLCRIVEGRRYREFRGSELHRDIAQVVWPSAWRSGLGLFMSYGLTQISGVIYAQIGSAASIASYLLALRFIQVIASMARAPFYSKLPMLARYYSEGRTDRLIATAKRGMVLSYWVLVIGLIVIGGLAPPLLVFIKSNAEFVPPTLWALLGLAFFAERFGAMHIQLYSTTNRIIWHIANGVSGSIFIIASLVLFPVVGVYAFPIGYLCGYLGFYGWYSAMHSYNEFNLKFWNFESKTMLAPLAILLLYSFTAIFIG